MSNIAIEFNNVGKMYRLGRVGTGTLSHDLNRWWQTSILRHEDPYLKIGQTNDRTTKGDSDYVWALRDISFKVEQGDVVGIIGKNGAGKSTLLKLLSNITSPSTGSIKYQGRIASLLEVGTGFHPEMTGRENIYMNGSIMGMTKPEITRKLDEIVDFAGVERYLDTPVKRYSSGMTVRLGFAVAAFLEPEILVVDEVLTVGDAEFQKKAIGKMDSVAKEGGRTVLFVSHNMTAVKLLCKSGVVLKNGQLEFIGSATDCVNRYVGSNISNFCNHLVVDQDARTKVSFDLFKEIEIMEIFMDNDIFNMSTDEPIALKIKCKRNKSSVKAFNIVITISNEEDQKLINYVTPLLDIAHISSDIFWSSLNLYSHGLPKGKYKIQVACGLKDYSYGSTNFDIIENALAFNVIYTNCRTKKDYYAWDSTWAKVVHESDCIEAKIFTN